jgi:hydrogenase expression/formation protein HypE
VVHFYSATLVHFYSALDRQYSAVIGEVVEAPEKRVILKTNFGGERIVDMIVGDQLPRIC